VTISCENSLQPYVCDSLRRAADGRDMISVVSARFMQKIALGDKVGVSKFREEESKY